MPPFANDWICTRSGLKFYPTDPKPAEIAIEDIACGLSRRFRFGGQSVRTYTVAEHSIAVSGRLTDRQAALWGLLHDAAEAWLPDVQRPLKRHLAVCVYLEDRITYTSYHMLEDRILAAVAAKYGLPTLMPVEVARADDRELARERRDLFDRNQPAWPDLTCEPYPEPIGDVMGPAAAEAAFLVRFRELW